MDQKHHSPHIGDFTGPICDYNGTGRWSVASVQQRYIDYCRTLGVNDPQVPRPQEHREGDNLWIYPIMYPVIAGIERDDKAAVALGVEFIEESEHFVFGRILKSNTARALRRATLATEQITRLRERIVGMLLAGEVPHEYHEYARLLRRTWSGPCVVEVRAATCDAGGVH